MTTAMTGSEVLCASSTLAQYLSAAAAEGLTASGFNSASISACAADFVGAFPLASSGGRSIDALKFGPVGADGAGVESVGLADATAGEVPPVPVVPVVGSPVSVATGGTTLRAGGAGFVAAALASAA